MNHANFMKKLLEGVEVEWKALGEVGETLGRRLLPQTPHSSNGPILEIDI